MIEWDDQAVRQMIADRVNVIGRRIHADASVRAEGRFSLRLREASVSDITAEITSPDEESVVLEFGTSEQGPESWALLSLMGAGGE